MGEIMEGRGVGPKQDHIYLQLHHLKPELLHERLPGISETARIFAGVDVTQQPIPVIPTVHYNMGGIPTNYMGEVLTVDEDGNDQVVKGLMAAGEAGCVSVHGANRLGANSLLDIVIFGRKAVITIAENMTPYETQPDLSDDAGMSIVDKVDRLRISDGKYSSEDIRDAMQEAMSLYCGVFREDSLLKKGC